MFDRNIINHLKKWKDKQNKKPLILRGARQVGKTSVVKLFAEQEFEEFLNINLEKAEEFELFKNVESLEEFLKIARIALRKKIIPGKTLIFIDEIQNAPNLIELLRFFYEDSPDLHVIAAGSLLEVKIEKQGLTMPVGRVEYAYLFPLTFFEFLKAIEENELLDFLKNISLDTKITSGIHQQALKLFNEYAKIGGMPEIVSLYIKKSSQEELDSVYSSLLTAYLEDVYKYSGKADIKYISHVLEQAPYFAGERVVYEKFGGSVFKSREMGEAFGVLEKAMLLTQIISTKSDKIPLIGQKKRSKKLLFLDVGLVNYRNNIQSEFLRIKDLSDVYRGKIAEQIVGQNILARNIIDAQSLYYWAREKPKGSAEVDFCFLKDGEILGIEVKSGNSSKLKSLFSFGSLVEKNKLIRIFSGELSNEKIIYAKKEYKLLSLPFYLVNRI